MTRATLATLALLPAWVAFSQSTGNPPAFDVASIKPNTSRGSKLGKGIFLPGQVAFPNGTLKLFIMTHRKERVTPEYALMVGKSGPKLEPSPQPGERKCTWEDADHGRRRRVCHNMTMAELASALPGWGGTGIDRPVVDLTGLKGNYDFHFEIGPAPRKPGAAGNGDSGPTIFEALAQLGLKLESRKGSVSTIVIDHAEKPTPN